MQRRNFILQSALALPSISLIAKSFAVDPWTIKMLNKTAGIFTEKGGTILFKFTKEGIVIIDSQFPDQADHLISELKKQNAAPFELLINTHHHGDHTGGNIKFKGLVRRVLAHTNSKANQMRVAQTNNNENNQLFPTQTYDVVWSEKIGKDKITLQYLGAGHTNGDSLIYVEKDGIVHMGDLLFNRRHPFIDRPAGANISSWIKVLEKTINVFPAKTTYVFGHAAEGYQVTGNVDDIRAFKNYLDALLNFTSKEIAAGKSKEEILKATAIPGAPEWKGDGASRPVTAAFEELTQK